MQHIAATLAFIAVLMAALLWQQHLPAVRLQRNSSPPPLLSRVCQHSGQQRTPQFSGLKTKLVAVPIHAGHHTGPSSGDSSGDSSAGPGSSQQPGKATKQQRGPLQSLISQTVLLSRIVGTLLLLIAAAPYLISSRLGTAAAAAAASRVLPGDVRIQRISLGWTQPVALYGLTVFESEAGSSRQLIALQRFSSAEPLHEVVTGKSHLTLTLTNPSIDGSLTDAGDNFRLVRYLEQSRLLSILTGRHHNAAAAVTAAAKAAAGSAAAAAQHDGRVPKIHSHPIEVPETASVQDDRPVAAAAAAPAAGRGAGSEARADLHSKQQSGAAIKQQSGDAASVSSSSSSSTTSTSKGVQQGDGAAAAAHASSPLPLNFIQRLAQADASSHVSAELRLPMLSVYIPDGELLLPQELAAAMGSHIHAVAAAGTSAVQDLADELEEDRSWMDVQQQQQQQQQRQEEGKQVDALHQTWALPPAGVGKKAWAHAHPILLQVSGDRVSALVRGWHLGSIFRLRQSHLVLQQPATATWEFTPELAKLTLSQFNPLLEEVAFIRECGSLETAIAPTDGRLPAESGQLWVSPVKLVVGRGNLLSQIYRLLGFHGRFGSHKSGHTHKQPWLSGSSSGSSTVAAAEKEAAEAAGDDGSAVEGVEVWSGPLRVTMEAPGVFRTDRVDMILGSGRSSMHLALWGTVDTNTNSIDMTVGLPAATLAKAGVKGLPPGYLLPVAVGGPLHRPQVAWNAAVRQLAVLSAMQLGREAWQYEGEKVAGALWGAVTHEQGGVPAGLAGLFGAANRALSKATSSFIGQVDERLQTVLQNVPPPADLPWEDEQASNQHPARQHKS